MMPSQYMGPKPVFQMEARVGFTSDTEEGAGYDWKRKNTPHPFRNQRISGAPGDDETSNEQKVRDIMANMSSR